MGTPVAETQEMITEEAIRVRSYIIWQREGRPQGKDIDHWLSAIEELAREQRAALVVRRCEAIVLPRVRISHRPSRITTDRISAHAA
jgi:Protein of unknown function (DUF2934)